MADRDKRDFGELVLVLFLGTLAFRYLRRCVGLDVSDPAASPEEQLCDALGEVNEGELRAGRPPFLLVREPRGYMLRVIPRES
jgi:hypothetical protein